VVDEAERANHADVSVREGSADQHRALPAEWDFAGEQSLSVHNWIKTHDWYEPQARPIEKAEFYLSGACGRSLSLTRWPS
jgi:hypothetical protein